jgi:hypothetical protein
MALVELGSRGVLLPDAKVELTSQWPDYLGAEPFEYTPPCSTELLRVHDLMERDGPRGTSTSPTAVRFLHCW